MPPHKKKLYVYLMGHISEQNSIVRAIEVELDLDNTVQDILQFLIASNKIKSKTVWASLKQHGTKLNEHVTIKDMESIVEEGGQGGDIALFVYNGDSGEGIERERKGEMSMISGKQPERGRDKNMVVQQQMEEIKLGTSAKSMKLVPTDQSLEPITENRPRKISKKQSIKTHNKNECCLLM